MDLKKQCLYRMRVAYPYSLFTIVVAALPLLLATTASAQQSFLLTPLEFDFGDVPVGATASPQEVTITNVSGVSQSPVLAGGGSAIFGGATNCNGRTLAPGESCFVEYRFKPTDVGPETGTVTLGVNGQSASFSFMGNGIEPFLISPLTFDFGEIEVGNTSPFQSVDIVNVSKVPQAVDLAGGGSSIFGGATNCNGRTLAPGESCFVEYRFKPTDVGPVTDTVTLGVNGQSASLSFTGIGGTSGADPFLISPLSFDFGNIATGETAPSQEVTITNVSGVSQSPVLAGGGSAIFGGATNCNGRTLAPGESCFVEYRFKPTDVGPETGTVTLGVNGQSASFSFMGNGIEPFLISPLTFDFGEIEVGNTSPFQSVDIVNVSKVPQAVDLAGGGSSIFGGATNCNGRTLAPGESCFIEYRFSPTDVEPVTDTITLMVNGRSVDLSFFGNGPEMPAPVPGDLNEDGLVDATDYSLFRSTLGKCSGDAGFIAEADYDGDGCITYADYRIWYGYFRNQ